MQEGDTTKGQKEGRGPLPPVYLLLCIGLAVLLHYFAPITTIIPDPLGWIGVAVIVIGVLVIAFPAVSFSAADTTIIPFRESSSLVISGLFRYTRNPMYVGMVIIIIGTDILLRSLSPFVVPVLFVIIINRMIIPVEERMLERMFGDDYRDYKNTVRRWI